MSNNDIDKKMDAIFMHFDSLFNSGEFEEANHKLASYDVSQLDSCTIIALLTATLVAHDKLPYRKTFYEWARERLKEIYTGDIEELLMGLK